MQTGSARRTVLACLGWLARNTVPTRRRPSLALGLACPSEVGSTRNPLFPVLALASSSPSITRCATSRTFVYIAERRRCVRRGSGRSAARLELVEGCARGLAGRSQGWSKPEKKPAIVSQPLRLLAVVFFAACAPGWPGECALSRTRPALPACLPSSQVVPHNLCVSRRVRLTSSSTAARRCCGAEREESERVRLMLAHCESNC